MVKDHGISKDSGFRKIVQLERLACVHAVADGRALYASHHPMELLEHILCDGVARYTQIPGGHPIIHRFLWFKLGIAYIFVK